MILSSGPSHCDDGCAGIRRFGAGRSYARRRYLDRRSYQSSPKPCGPLARCDRDRRAPWRAVALRCAWKDFPLAAQGRRVRRRQTKHQPRRQHRPTSPRCNAGVTIAKARGGHCRNRVAKSHSDGPARPCWSSRTTPAAGQTANPARVVFSFVGRRARISKAAGPIARTMRDAPTALRWTMTKPMATATPLSFGSKFALDNAAGFAAPVCMAIAGEAPHVALAVTAPMAKQAGVDLQGAPRQAADDVIALGDGPGSAACAELRGERTLHSVQSAKCRCARWRDRARSEHLTFLYAMERIGGGLPRARSFADGDAAARLCQFDADLPHDRGDLNSQWKVMNWSAWRHCEPRADSADAGGDPPHGGGVALADSLSRGRRNSTTSPAP